MSNERVTDLSYLQDIAMGDQEIVIETTEAFLDDAPQLLDQIHSHFANQEWEKLHKQAHKIKPSLQYMGMNRAWELIKDIEEQAKTENISDDLEGKIEEFDDLCSRGMNELSSKIEQLKAS